MDTLHRCGAHSELGWSIAALQTGALLAITDDEVTALMAEMERAVDHTDKMTPVMYAMVNLLWGWLQVRGHNLSPASEIIELKRQVIELKSQVTTLECMAQGNRP